MTVACCASGERPHSDPPLRCAIAIVRRASPFGGSILITSAPEVAEHRRTRRLPRHPERRSSSATSTSTRYAPRSNRRRRSPASTSTPPRFPAPSGPTRPTRSSPPSSADPRSRCRSAPRYHPVRDGPAAPASRRFARIGQQPGSGLRPRVAHRAHRSRGRSPRWPRTRPGRTTSSSRPKPTSTPPARSRPRTRPWPLPVSTTASARPSMRMPVPSASGSRTSPELTSGFSSTGPWPSGRPSTPTTSPRLTGSAAGATRPSTARSRRALHPGGHRLVRRGRRPDRQGGDRARRVARTAGPRRQPVDPPPGPPPPPPPPLGTPLATTSSRSTGG